MAKWIPILTAPTYGEKPYDWGSTYKYQCTWFAYYRPQKNGWPAPCWHNKQTQTPGWTTAKDWAKNVRDPWVAIDSNDKSYIPVPGDIIVFTGNYGHVAVIEETIKANVDYIISDYNRIQPETYDTCHWAPGEILKGYINTGAPIAYLHYEPGDPKEVTPVSRNTKVNQIDAPDPALRVRLEPSLEGEYYCSITPGYYNVLAIIEASAADKKQVEGLECWYEIEEGKYCANITTTYLPKNNPDPEPTPTPTPDPSGTIDKLFKELQTTILALESENTKLINRNNELESRNAELEKENQAYKEGLNQIADIVSKLVK